MLAKRLLDHGIPVVVCKPNQRWKPGDPSDVIPPTGWNTLTVEQARADITKYRPGIDALAMVGGHGIDVLDYDTKIDGVDLTDVQTDVQTFGLTITPSGGIHQPVASTGYGKGDFIIDGKHVGDYVGGTKAGGSRLLCFLPGSRRPKYPDTNYIESQPWDIAGCLDSFPDDVLTSILAASTLSTEGEAGKPAVTNKIARDFLAEHSEVVECEYGTAAIRSVLAAATSITIRDSKRGRHAWACRSITRAVELMKAGCLDARAITKISDELDRRKPEGGTSVPELVKWAVANTEPKTGCWLHSLVLRARAVA